MISQTARQECSLPKNWKPVFLKNSNGNINLKIDSKNHKNEYCFKYSINYLLLCSLDFIEIFH